MITPRFLKPNDKVVILSPSGKIESQWVEGLKEVLESYGLIVSVSEHALCGKGRFAGTDEERIKDLQEAIDDQDVRAIFCSRGGYGLARIIDKIDFSSLAKDPKWVVGFSDITVLHNALSRVGVVSIHGIMAKHITLKAEGLENLMSILFGHEVDYEIPAHEFNKEGDTAGELVGGNLSVLYGLRGTPFDIDYSGKILFIEDLGERLYHIDRMIQNLRLGGVFEQIRGLVVGQFTDIDEDDSFAGGVYGVIAEAVKDYNIPVCFNFPAGHVENNQPLKMGAEYYLEVQKNKTILKCLN
jgi:muramoyltetrapeptide carboxypeptidase